MSFASDMDRLHGPVDILIVHTHQLYVTQALYTHQIEHSPVTRSYEIVFFIIECLQDLLHLINSKELELLIQSVWL